MNRTDRQGKAPWRILLSVLTAFALLAAACGGSDAETVVDTSAVDEANAALQAAQDKTEELEAELEAAQAAASEGGADDGALADVEAALEEAQAATAAAEERASAAEAAVDESAMAEPTRSINVALVNNGAMDDIVELTEKYFTAETGIEVNYTVLEEQTLREVATRDLGTGGGQFDVAQIGMYEAPQFGANNWIFNLSTSLKTMLSTTSTT